MTDVRTVLRHGAGGPPKPLDLAAVAARAEHRRLWKRALAWVSALGAIAGLAVPVGTALVPAGHGHVAVRTVHPPGRADERLGSFVPAGGAASSPAATNRPGGANASASTAAMAGGRGPALAAPSGRLLTPSTTTTAHDCVVQGGDYGVDAPPYGGAGIGGYPTCDYVADARAGYRAYAASWEIDITKPNGVRTTIGPGPVVGAPHASCGAVGTIEPGDHVHVVLYTGAENTASVQWVKVGPGYHC